MVSDRGLVVKTVGDSTGQSEHMGFGGEAGEGGQRQRGGPNSARPGRLQWELDSFPKGMRAPPNGLSAEGDAIQTTSLRITLVLRAEWTGEGAVPSPALCRDVTLRPANEKSHGHHEAHSVLNTGWGPAMHLVVLHFTHLQRHAEGTVGPEKSPAGMYHWR